MEQLAIKIDLESALKERRAHLKEAEQKAEILFGEIENCNLIRAGVSEKAINEQIFQLAFKLFGIKKYWHKRIVRAGKNTLYPYKENPPDLIIQNDDIVFLDFGPIFEDWEADFGRTYVIGQDENKLKLRDDINSAWVKGREFFNSKRDITCAELFHYVDSVAKHYGWEFGNSHCGHLIGKFPHERIEDSEIGSYIHPENSLRMRSPDKDGLPRDWILEIHFISSELEIGGFCEQLLVDALS